jgi:hypothetical protein
MERPERKGSAHKYENSEIIIKTVGDVGGELDSSGSE